ncbi:MAG: DUF4158 domain-containing protein [Bacteroidetes bacterium]|nr:DUF4158 domain-containing protein [Fibrella sp.]
MALRADLSPDERTRFDSPPTLAVHQRLILLDLPVWAESYLQAIQTSTNQVGFLLQLGYFRILSASLLLTNAQPEGSRRAENERQGEVQPVCANSDLTGEKRQCQREQHGQQYAQIGHYEAFR